MGIASRLLAAALISLRSELRARFPPAAGESAVVPLAGRGDEAASAMAGLRGGTSSQLLPMAPRYLGGGGGSPPSDGDIFHDGAAGGGGISEEAHAEMEHFIDSSAAHGIAAAFSVIAVIVSIHLIWMHLVYYSRPLLQRQIVRIIMIVPVYAICSAFSLTFEHYAVYINTIRDVYEAYCIHCFLVLMLDFPGGEPAVVDGIKEHGTMKHPVPCCCFPTMRLGVDFIVAMKRTTLQFVILKPLMAFLALVFMATGKFDTAEAQWFLLVVYNLSYTTALYGLFLFYKATKTLLQGFSPVRKFAAVKIIVFATYYQSLIVVAIPGMDELGSSERWNDFIICFEMALFAIMHEFAFSHKEFMPGGVGVRDLSAMGYEEPVNLRLDTSPAAAYARIWDVFNFKDTWEDVKRNFSSNAGTHMMLGVDGGILNEGTAQRLDDDGENAAARAERVRALGLGARGIKEVALPDEEEQAKKEKEAAKAAKNAPFGMAALSGLSSQLGALAKATGLPLGGGASHAGGLAADAEAGGAGSFDGSSEFTAGFDAITFGGEGGAGGGGAGHAGDGLPGGAGGDSGAGEAGDAAAEEAYKSVLAAAQAKQAAAAAKKEEKAASEAASSKTAAAAGEHSGGSASASAPAGAAGAHASSEQQQQAAPPPGPASKTKAAAALVEASAAAAAEMLKKLKEQKAGAAAGATPAKGAKHASSSSSGSVSTPAPAPAAPVFAATHEERAAVESAAKAEDGPAVVVSEASGAVGAVAAAVASVTGSAVPLVASEEQPVPSSLRPSVPLSGGSEGVAEAEGMQANVLSPGKAGPMSPGAIAAEVEEAASAAVLDSSSGSGSGGGATGSGESAVAAASHTKELSARQKAALERQSKLKLDASKVNAAPAPTPAAPLPSFSMEWGTEGAGAVSDSPFGGGGGGEGGTGGTAGEWDPDAAFGGEAAAPAAAAGEWDPNSAFGSEEGAAPAGAGSRVRAASGGAGGGEGEGEGQEGTLESAPAQWAAEDLTTSWGAAETEAAHATPAKAPAESGVASTSVAAAASSGEAGGEFDSWGAAEAPAFASPPTAPATAPAEAPGSPAAPQASGDASWGGEFDFR